ncbi:hypothetical protein PAXRUDRAFT_728708 [Paxillus rubicundulus Ve08.2h10]|uniref:Uncharacterized protein n=1 Tax=Paxillus rubicundulus Ve08.2h10 TaxID=930991 RepID=A0A0D0DCY8_9AGAM|nr:hypothetical protein PAXRUDRAFT_728708 [Paxillus rubicundulus Ve08.2h10]
MSRGGSLQLSAASRAASIASTTPLGTTNERAIAEVPASYQPSIRCVPGAIVNDPITPRGVSLGIASCEALKQAPLVGFGSPLLTQKPPSPPSVQSLIAGDDMGSVSDLTDIPTEFNSSPLMGRIISVVLDPETLRPPTPTKPSISMPLVSATSSSPSWPLPMLVSEPRVVLDYVEIPQPEWYKKMRASVQAMAASSSPGKRKQPEGSLSEDDIPVEQLPRRRAARPSALRRRPGPFPRVLSPLSSGVPETVGPSNTSVSRRSAPVKQPLPSQLASPRKRKISQTVASR